MGEACPKPGSYLRLWSEAFYPDVTDGDDYPEEQSDIDDRYSATEHVTDDCGHQPRRRTWPRPSPKWVLLSTPAGPKFVNDDPTTTLPSTTGDRVVDQSYASSISSPSWWTCGQHPR